MMRHISLFALLGLLIAAGAGCCCVQGMPGDACSATGCGPFGSGPLMGLASCRGACGEVYVDEWVSEPPVVDNCGYDCGGCGRCGSCRPVRNLLQMLWGRKYATSCNTGLCGPSCGGCSSCDSMGSSADFAGEMVFQGEHAASMSGSTCNCGRNHGSSSVYEAPSPPMGPMQFAPSRDGGASPMPHADSILQEDFMPPALPTPAPSITPTSAKRLNPAISRQR